MLAACNNPNPEVIIALLESGEDAKARDKDGKSAFDWAQHNEKLKGTAAYQKLNEAQH
jgi:ankyrin repeat protein